MSVHHQSSVNVPAVAHLYDQYHKFVIMNFSHDTIISNSVPPKATQISCKCMAGTTRIFAVNQIPFDPSHHLCALGHVKLSKFPISTFGKPDIVTHSRPSLFISSSKVNIFGLALYSARASRIISTSISSSMR